MEQAKRTEPVLIAGPSPQALLDHCLDALQQCQEHWPGRRACILVPEDRKLVTEQRFFARFPDQALLWSEVLSFTRLASLWIEALEGPRNTPLDRGAKVLLLRNLLFQNESSLPKLSCIGRRVGYLDKLLDVLGDWQRSRYTPEEIVALSSICKGQEEFAQILQEWGILLRLYQNHLQDGAYSDCESRLEALGSYLEQALVWKKQGLDPTCWPFPYCNLAPLVETCFWITGFAESRLFTPQELRILYALAELSAGLTLTLCAPAEEARRGMRPEGYFSRETLRLWRERFPDTIYTFLPSPCRAEQREWVVLQTDSHETQVQLCLGELCRLRAQEPGRPWSAYGIAVCDPVIESILAPALQNLGISSTLDCRQPIANSPVLRYLFGLIQIHETGWSREAVVAFLRTGLAGMDPDEIDELENLWLARGMDHLTLFDDSRYFPSWHLLSEASLQDEEEESMLEGESDQGTSRDAVTAQFLLQKQSDALAWENRRRVLDPVRTFLAGLPREARAGEWVERLQDFFEEQGLEFRVVEQMEWALSHSESQALNLSLGWKELLDSFQNFCTLMPDAPCSFGELQELLEDILQGRYAERLPISADAVVVGPPEQLLGQCHEVLFLIGAEAERFPGIGGEQGLLRDVQRQWIQKQGTRPFPARHETAVQQRAALVHRLREAFSQRLYCALLEGESLPAWMQAEVECILEPEVGRTGQRSTWASSFVQWRAQEPQSALRDVRLILPEYSCFRTSDLDGVSFESARPVQLEAGDLKALLPRPLQLSISQLQGYRNCPYSYFVQFLLRAKPRQVFEPNRASLGSLLHSALAHYLQPLMTMSPEQVRMWIEESLQTTDRVAEQACELIETVLREESEAFSAFAAPGIRSSLGRKAQRMLQQALPMIAEELRIGEGEKGIWIPNQLEAPFSVRLPLPSIPTGETHYILRGIFDRVDCCETPEGMGVRILDYKTGSKTLDWNQIYHGLDLQLPLYLQVYRLSHPERLLLDANYRTTKCSIEEVQEVRGFCVTQNTNPSHCSLESADQASRAASSLARGLGSFRNWKVVGENQPKNLQNGLDQLLLHSQLQAERLVCRLLQGEMTAQPVAVEGSTPFPCTYCRCKALCRLSQPTRMGCRLKPPIPSKRQSREKQELALLEAVSRNLQEKPHA